MYTCLVLIGGVLTRINLRFLCFLPYLFIIYKHTSVHCCTYTIGQIKDFSLIHMKREPCKGLVKKSLSMSCMGQSATIISPFLILSVMKNYLMSKCRMHLLLEGFPFSANGMVLLLSW